MNMFVALDSFNLFSDFQSSSITESPKDKECQNYLDIGTKILDLVREKNDVCFQEIPILDIGYKGYKKAKYGMDYIRKRISDKYLSPITQERINSIVEEVSYCIDLKLEPTDNQSVVHLQRQSKSDGTPYIIHLDHMEPIYAIDGLVHKFHWGTLRATGETVVCLDYILADFLIYKEVNNYFSKNTADNVLLERTNHNIQWLFKHNWHVSDSFDEYTSLLQAEFNMHSKGITFGGKSSDLTNVKKYATSAFIPVLICILKRLPRFSLFRETKSDFVLGELFMQVVEEYQADLQTASYIKKVSTSCATAWQTKKNIPKHIVAAMETSKFNEGFGYVEFDQDVDLEKIKQLEKEFDALKIFFRQNCLKEYSLRFRYLGKHKALGLYFPTVHCLCVDLSSPSSFSHEYFHLLDFKFGRLSRKYSFEPIRKSYELALVQELKNTGKYDSIKASSSKYNLTYYLEPTEIFARCGEMYLVQKGVNNSLVSPDKTAGFAYPENETLTGMIVEYFDKLLPSLYEY